MSMLPVFPGISETVPAFFAKLIIHKKGGAAAAALLNRKAAGRAALCSKKLFYRTISP